MKNMDMQIQHVVSGKMEESKLAVMGHAQNEENSQLKNEDQIQCQNPGQNVFGLH